MRETLTLNISIHEANQNFIHPILTCVMLWSDKLTSSTPCQAPVTPNDNPYVKPINQNVRFLKYYTTRIHYSEH